MATIEMTQADRKGEACDSLAFSVSALAIDPPSAPILSSIEPVGAPFFAYARRRLQDRTLSEDERLTAEEDRKREIEKKNVLKNEETSLVIDNVDLYQEFEAVENELDADEIDPRDWHKVDLYALLGLGRLRWRATEAQIRAAHRQKVLVHHPDKSKTEQADAIFKCLQKASEVMLDSVKRRQYDSIDCYADVIPSDASDFYKRWSDFFEAESRFSKKQPVPFLGDSQSSKEHVEKFYNFWYRFDSWRSFEWLDKAIPDDGENRDNKRWQEKKNKGNRQKRKLEDNLRLRKQIDLCMSQDPRIKQFRKLEKEAKERARLKATANYREADAAKEQEKSQQALEKQQEEEQLRLEAEAGKKAYEQRKKQMKKEKKVIKTAAKSNNYFGTSSIEVARGSAAIDCILSSMNAELQSQLCNQLENDTDPKEAFKSVTQSLIGANLVTNDQVDYILNL